MDFKKFIILSLACYRLSQLIALDNGPLSIFTNLRNWTDKKAEKEQKIGNSGVWQSFNDGLHCPFCVGVWIAGILTIIYSGIHWYSLPYLLAIAGVQSFLEELKK